MKKIFKTGMPLLIPVFIYTFGVKADVITPSIPVTPLANDPQTLIYIIIALSCCLCLTLVLAAVLGIMLIRKKK